MKILFFLASIYAADFRPILWFSAEMVFSSNQLNLKIDNPFPSIANGIWLIGYSCYIYAL